MFSPGIYLSSNVVVGDAGGVHLPFIGKPCGTAILAVFARAGSPCYFAKKQSTYKQETHPKLF
jgi:hypothetical protein